MYPNSVFAALFLSHYGNKKTTRAGLLATPIIFFPLQHPLAPRKTLSQGYHHGNRSNPTKRILPDRQGNGGPRRSLAKKNISACAETRAHSAFSAAGSYFDRSSVGQQQALCRSAAAGMLTSGEIFFPFLLSHGCSTSEHLLYIPTPPTSLQIDSPQGLLFCRPLLWQPAPPPPALLPRGASSSLAAML